MTELIEKAVAKLAERMPDGFPNRAKFEIAGEGSIIVDPQGVRAADEPAEITLHADLATFRGMLEGRVNPMTAFMTGKLRVEGPMGLAMKLGKAMS